MEYLLYYCVASWIFVALIAATVDAPLTHKLALVAIAPLIAPYGLYRFLRGLATGSSPKKNQ